MFETKKFEIYFFVNGIIKGNLNSINIPERRMFDIELGEEKLGAGSSRGDF